MNLKVLVIGTGFLGSHLVKQLKNNKIIVMNTNYQNLDEYSIFLDITNISSIEKLINKFKPNIIINCAAITNVDYLELNPKVGFSINSYGPKNLALICEKNKIKLIHISTDSIFDGREQFYSEEDFPNPINIYSKSKLLGEKLIIENLSNHIIIRTNFFGYHKNNNFLFNFILKNLYEKKEFNGFNDVFFNPLEISNLNDLIIELCNLDFNGIINLASDEVISKYEFGLKIANIFNLDPQLVIKDSIKNFESTAKRPMNTSLSNNKSKKFLKTKTCSLDYSLKKIKKQFF